jgi:hypothetical protein
MGLEPTDLLTASQALYQLSYAPKPDAEEPPTRVPTCAYRKLGEVGLYRLARAGSCLRPFSLGTVDRRRVPREGDC